MIAVAQQTSSVSISRAKTIQALFAIAFGIFLYVGTGFASPSVIHNATHDTRHALGFPCH